MLDLMNDIYLLLRKKLYSINRLMMKNKIPIHTIDNKFLPT